jgi:hypothetical protein
VRGGQILTPPAMTALLDRTVRALRRNLNTETDESFAPTSPPSTSIITGVKLTLRSLGDG